MVKMGTEEILKSQLIKWKHSRKLICFYVFFFVFAINHDCYLPGSEAVSVPQASFTGIRRKLTVQYYEPVFYNPSELLAKRRRKREIGSAENVKIVLNTKSRDFHLNLDHDKSVFHPDVLIESVNGPLNYDTDKVFSGHLDDDPGSKIEGIITSKGHFEGVISTSLGQEFHVEPASRYEETQSSPSPGIIYEKESIDWPSVPCASQNLYLNTTNLSTVHKSHHFHNSYNLNNESASASYTTPTMRKTAAKSRSKRYIIDPRRTTCMLYLQADHLFYKYFETEEATINMMARHIQRVNEIYRGTDFDGDGKPDGISFMIKRIKVHNSNSSLSPNYKYSGDFQVIKYLEKFSEGDYESFCLAYMFTFRDFEGGTLGLAWTGDLKNAGGVCERKGHFRGGLKSLNTGIITLLNYGKVVLPAVSYVTLAHEIGHNFGSPHDPESDKECVPGGVDGHYIMYARATGGDQKNNQRFSPCSLRSILPVLNAKARNIHGCFSEPQRGICGNRDVEEGEECDCGWEEDCVEDCCWPMRLKYDKKERPCTLKPRKECSPSQGPCCTAGCRLKIGDKCRDDNGCRHKAFCDGYMAKCPPSEHKPNKTICQDEQNVCFLGECTGSICLAYGLESCQCSPKPWDHSSKLCELCCKRPGEGEPCLSSFELNEPPYDVPDLFSKPGSPCKNYTGYCDAYHTCREVDPSGPLATLRNLLLADEGLTAIAHWIDTHWYAVVGFVALLIIMMVLTAKLCGRQAKKKLRKITVLHSNMEAIQVERSYWDESGEHVVHPAAVRKKIPLRKKIRERKKKGAKGLRQVPSSNSLWRRRRERAKLPKTDLPSGPATNVAPGGNFPSSSSSAQTPPQSFDLVQLQTPPITAAAAASATSSSNCSSSSSSSSSNSNTNAKSTPIYPTLNLNPLDDSAPPPAAKLPVPGPSGQQGPTPTTHPVVSHDHEPKTVILPSTSRKRTHRHKSSSKAVKASSDQNPLGKPKLRSNSKAKSRRLSAAAKTSKSKQESKKKKAPKKSIQILYTPPFSVKVVQVESSPRNNTIKNKSEGESSAANNNALNKPIVEEGVVEQKSKADHQPQPQQSSNSKETSNNDEKLQTSSSSKSTGPAKTKKSTNSANSSSSAASKSASKIKSSSSFLQRRKKKGGKSEKSELRVLIPPSPLDDDGEVVSPVTPGS